MNPRRVVLAVAACALALATVCGCGARQTPPRPGDAFVLARKELTPRGLHVTRETWTLADTAGGRLHWRVEREGGTGRDQWTERADLEAGRPAVRRGRRALEGEVVVSVPAGRFRCTRLARTREEPEGRVMDVTEWWTPGVPVPVQRWERWSGLPERLRFAPPRRDADLVMGAEWAVLERAPRR